MTLPTLISAIVPDNGTTIILTFTTSMLPVSSIAGFIVRTNGYIASIATNHSKDNTIILTMKEIITIGQGISIQYTPGNVTDSSSPVNNLDDFGPLAAINNSKQMPDIAHYKRMNVIAMTNLIGADMSGFGLDPLGTYELVNYTDLVRSTNNNHTPAY